MKAKKLAVYIKNNSRSIYVAAPYGKLLKGLLCDAGITMSMPCGGMGRCGKCKVTFIKGAPMANSLDTAFLTEEEIKAGVRLACRCVLDKDCIISADGLSFNEDEMEVQSVETSDNIDKVYDRYGIAIDLGTTTIAVALVGYVDGDEAGEVIRTASGVNHQRVYGSDVISRIDASGSDHDKARNMRELVTSDIEALIDEVSAPLGKRPEIACLAGNTTMLYLLSGDNTEELGRYPYNASFLEPRTIELRGIKTYIFPGISAFVGADIVSGIYSLGLLRSDKRALLIDLGTNGEIAYYDGDKLLTTSTAAGPVFEGGGIAFGVASVPGAISHVTIDNEKASVEVIGDAEPVGLCGTAVIETVSELLRNGIMSEIGLLKDEFFKEGFPIVREKDIFFTQNDIRNVQLAKAAIYTGVKALVKESMPEKVYISGGFGSHIDVEKISNISMFPKEFNGNMLSVGNTSLKGCIRYISEVFSGKETEATSQIQEIIDRAENIVLADDNDFNAEYLKAMNF